MLHHQWHNRLPQHVVLAVHQHVTLDVQQTVTAAGLVHVVVIFAADLAEHPYCIGTGVIDVGVLTVEKRPVAAGLTAPLLTAVEAVGELDLTETEESLADQNVDADDAAEENAADQAPADAAVTTHHNCCS